MKTKTIFELHEAELSAINARHKANAVKEKFIFIAIGILTAIALAL